MEKSRPHVGEPFRCYAALIVSKEGKEVESERQQCCITLFPGPTRTLADIQVELDRDLSLQAPASGVYFVRFYFGKVGGEELFTWAGEGKSIAEGDTLALEKGRTNVGRRQ
jgi:hypothetical protein